MRSDFFFGPHAEQQRLNPLLPPNDEVSWLRSRHLLIFPDAGKASLSVAVAFGLGLLVPWTTQNYLAKNAGLVINHFVTIALLIVGCFSFVAAFVFTSAGLFVAGSVLFVGGLLVEEMVHQRKLLKEIRDLWRGQG